MKNRKACEKGQVNEWKKLFGHSKPKIAALFGLATGGTHFVLHKMQGHPQILALKQRALYPELKYYFGEGSYPIQQLLDKQLRPKKDVLDQLGWIVVNKPQMAFISNHFLFNRAQISNLYCFRNPIALFHSRAQDRREIAKRVHNRSVAWEEIAQSIVTEYRVSMAAFAQVYSSEVDLILNLESFAAQVDDHLSAIWALLGVDVLADKQLKLLKNCEICGRPLETREGQVGRRVEDLLYCAYDDLFYTGPGGYNYIRKFNINSLASWKEKNFAEELKNYFAKELGADLINFFANEDYLNVDSRQTFKTIYEATLNEFQVGPA